MPRLVHVVQKYLLTMVHITEHEVSELLSCCTTRVALKLNITYRLLINFCP